MFTFCSFEWKTDPMRGSTRQAVIGNLRAAMDKLESRPALPQAGEATAVPAEPAAPFLRLDPEGLHEIWTPLQSGTGAALGFALGQGRVLVSEKRPVVLFLSLAHEGGETGLPYGPGLGAFGFGPDTLVLVRGRSMRELLWAAEEAACSPALAGVIVESLVSHQMLDFTALRRLALRSGASGTPVLLLRYGSGREASAARTRWRIAPCAALADPHDGSAPGAPRWRAVLEKAPKGQRGEWILSWSGEGFIAEKDNGRHPRISPAPSGALFSLLGDRLVQAH